MNPANEDLCSNPFFTNNKSVDEGSDPMSFLHLDLLTKMLMRENGNMYSDFKAKVDFIREQENILLENERNLIAVNEIKEELNISLSGVEEEIRESEYYLNEIEELLQNVPERVYSCPTCNHYHNKEKKELVEIFQSVGSSISECGILREEIENFNREASEYSSPWQLIYKIFDSHFKIIENAEIEVNKLESKVKDVVQAYNELATKFSESDMRLRYLG